MMFMIMEIQMCNSAELGHDVCLSEHLELLPIHLNLAPPVLWQKDLVSHAHTHGDGGSSLCSCSRSNSHHDCFQPLSLSLLRDQQTSLGSGLGRCSLNKDSVEQRQNFLGDS